MSDPSTRGPGDPEDFGPPGEPVTQTELDLTPSSHGGLPGWAKVAAVVAAVAVAGAAALAYRSHHRKKVLREGLARAHSLLRADTFAGYREASRLLEPLSALDPVEAGAMRAYALAALFADYRDPRASAEAEGLLVEPGRATDVPEAAQLAYAALALGRMEVGNAAGFAARTRSATGLALQARTSLAAGNLGAASEPLARAVQADPTLPMALALRGDVQRRSGLAGDALASYREALVASPSHPRATFGLAKLALSGQGDPAAAREALARLLDDREGTPRNERARAALYLAALQARAGDRAGAASTIDRAGLDPQARTWLEKAAGEMELHKGPYRVVGGAPPALVSASDDDPYVAPPPAPPRAEPAPAPSKKSKATVAKKKATAKKATAAKAKPKAKAKATAKSKAKPAAKKAAAKKPPAKKQAPQKAAAQ
jgi:hypothetical protein